MRTHPPAYLKLACLCLFLFSLGAEAQITQPPTVPGQWWYSYTPTSCGPGRVCADWIEDEHGYIMSCCIDESYLSTSDISACPELVEHYATYLYRDHFR